MQRNQYYSVSMIRSMYQFEEVGGRLFIQASIEGEGPPPTKRRRRDQDVGSSSEEDSDISLTDFEVKQKPY